MEELRAFEIERNGEIADTPVAKGIGQNRALKLYVGRIARLLQVFEDMPRG